MKRHTKSILTALSLLIIFVVFSCKNGRENNALPFFNKADFTPEWIPSDSISLRQLHTISPFSFRNQKGETITNQSLNGKIYIANFFFTECTGICPLMNKNLLLLQEAFQKDSTVMLVSHSVTPEEDTPEKLSSYAEINQIDNEKWHLLTGDKEEIYTLARQSYFAEEDFGIHKTAKQFLHTELCILIDSHGRIRGVYNGTIKLEVKRLIEDINTLKQEELL